MWIGIPRKDNEQLMIISGNQVERVDIHAHIAVTPPPFAERRGDPRWPSLQIDGEVGRLYRDGNVVRTLSPAVWSLEARLADLDETKLDHQILSLVPPMICETADADADTQWARHLNHEISAAVGQFPDRFSGMGTVPLAHPERAAEMLPEVKALGLVGVEIGTTAGGRELDDPALLEFFQAAGELGMFVLIHPISFGPNGAWTSRIQTTEINYGLGMTSDTAVAASRLVFGGTLAASPGLSVCLAHGGGTFAWALPRIAHMWDARHDVPAAQLVRNLYVDTVVFDPQNIRYLVDRLGADHLLFGTDHPMPGFDSLQGEVLNHLSLDERRLIESGNILRLLR
jgi:aminocarboxymuconate-semialdehyde decarboxylase